MLSLRELERVVRILDETFAGARVERWVQPDPERLVVTLYRRDPETGEGSKRHLLLSAAEGVARVSELAKVPKATDNPPALTAYLRAHLSRARLVRAAIRGRDRQLAIRFEAREGNYELLLSLLASRPASSHAPSSPKSGSSSSSLLHEEDGIVCAGGWCRAPLLPILCC